LNREQPFAPCFGVSKRQFLVQKYGWVNIWVNIWVNKIPMFGLTNGDEKNRIDMAGIHDFSCKIEKTGR